MLSGRGGAYHLRRGHLRPGRRRARVRGLRFVGNGDSSVTGLSGRYARALFELADEAGALDTVADDLRGLSRALEDSPDLARLVASPVLSRDEQGRAMAAVLAAMQARPLTARTVALLARRRRLFALAAIAADYLRLLAARRGEVAAKVVSACPLTAGEGERLRRALKAAAGREVAIEASVDPGLVGGLIVAIGSRMLDGSIRTKLQRLELAMKGAG